MILSGLPEKLPSCCDAALVKIKCAHTAYKEHPNIAQFYYGISGQDNVYAVIGKLSGYISLWTDGSQIEELQNFLKFLGFSGIFTSKKTASALNLKINEECLVFKIQPPFEAAECHENCLPRDLLNILRQGLEIPDGDQFVADVTFRVNHGCADYAVENCSGALMFFDESDALINGIAVPRNMRGKGQGSRIIKQILSRAGQRNVYACCIEKNKNFYIKNGFSLIGEAAYCEEQ